MSTMPIRHEIDTERGVVITTVEGVVSEQDMRDQPAAMYAHPDFSEEYDRLVDLRGVERFEVSADAIHGLARRTRAADGTRRALVVARDVGYGLARMYQTLRANESEFNRVFRSLEEARAWLGMD